MTLDGLINFIAQWIVVPIAGVIWKLWSDMAHHRTEIALLKQRAEISEKQRLADAADLRASLKSIDGKLDAINGRIDRAIGGKQ